MNFQIQRTAFGALLLFQSEIEVNRPGDAGGAYAIYEAQSSCVGSSATEPRGCVDD
jgi:hypothetical protein